MFDDIMGLHPKFRETVEAIATVDDLEGYENLCQMVRICVALVHICAHSTT